MQQPKKQENALNAELWPDSASTTQQIKHRGFEGFEPILKDREIHDLTESRPFSELPGAVQVVVACAAGADRAGRFSTRDDS